MKNSKDLFLLLPHLFTDLCFLFAGEIIPYPKQARFLFYVKKERYFSGYGVYSPAAV